LVGNSSGYSRFRQPRSGRALARAPDPAQASCGRVYRSQAAAPLAAQQALLPLPQAQLGGEGRGEGATS